eukprot:SAG25_NODE_2242_length_1803_cov_3.397887_1_plen_162_part_10
MRFLCTQSRQQRHSDTTVERHARASSTYTKTHAGSRVTPTHPAAAVAHDTGASISSLISTPTSFTGSCYSRRHVQHSSKMDTAAGRLRQDKAGVRERWRETPLAAKCLAAAPPRRRRWRRVLRSGCCSASAAPVANSRNAEGHSPGTAQIQRTAWSERGINI